MGVPDSRHERFVLGFLMSGPKTKSRLRTIARRMTIYYNLRPARVCPVLRRLERQGLVCREDRGPKEHVYSLTAAGREHFLRLLTCEPVPFDFWSDFLTRVFFFRFLTPGQALDQFAAHIAALEAQLVELENMRERVERRADANGRFVYETAVYMVLCLINWYRREWKRRGQQCPDAGRG